MNKIKLQKIPLFRQFILYIIVENICLTEERNCETMSKKENLLKRIEQLTEKQFEMLIYLYFQQEREFAQVVQSDHQTFLEPSA